MAIYVHKTQKTVDTMLIKVLKGNLHRGTVTALRIEYPGSVAIDPVLREAAGLVPNESALVADLDDGKY